MAKSVVAVSTVGYQKDKDDPNSVVWFEPGEAIKNVPQEVVDQWLANGTVGEPPAALANVQEEKDRLEARVAELEQQLADAKTQAKGPTGTTSPVEKTTKPGT